jgi:hypothetical protein
VRRSVADRTVTLIVLLEDKGIGCYKLSLDKRKLEDRKTGISSPKKSANIGTISRRTSWFLLAKGASQRQEIESE